MTKHTLPRICITLVCLCLLLSSCKTASNLTSTPAWSAAPTPSPTPHTLPTQTRTSPAAAPTPSVPPALEPVVFTFVPTTLQQSGKWNLELPYAEPGTVDWITASLDGYRLDPAFQIARIEMVYRWFGIGDRVKVYQKIEQRDSRFWREDTEIALEAVNRLVQSLNHLQPQPYPLNAITHTDDYPSLEIELTDRDNNHVLLYSDSNTPDFAPWNVVYNGRVYAQFNGQIAAALPDLFEFAEGQALASVYGPDLEASYFTVTTIDSLASLPRNFRGLLLLNEDFYYKPDPPTGALLGNLRFYGALGGIRKSLNDTILGLQQVEVEDAAGQAITCTLEALPGKDPDDQFYAFTCPVAEPGASGAYRFPIRLTFATNQAQTYLLTGELLGRWEGGTRIPATPFPDDIGSILKASPDVRDLLTDHQLVVMDEIAAADPVTGRLDHRWEADIALLGQVKIGERILPYSVTIDVKIENAGLVRWGLDRLKLQSFLQVVLNQPITSHFLTGDPNLVLNLYFADASERHGVSTDDLHPCAGLPESGELPSAGHPLRGFSFNRSWEMYQMQILLIGDDVRFRYLSIQPSLPKDVVWAALLPEELKPEGALPFNDLFQNSQAYWVIAFWDEHASVSDISTYEALLANWIGGIHKRENSIVLQQAMLDISDEGRLVLLHCPAP